MKKYRKVLIIGESDMVYVKEHIENMLKIDRSIQFTIITFTRNRYVEFYKKNNIRLIEIHYEQDKLNLNYLDRLMIKLLHNRFDYIHIQAVSLNALKLAQMISGDKSKIIATYWGFPKSKSEMISIKPYLKQIYKISFVTDSLQNYFVDFYGNGYREKSYCFDFGLGCIDIMRKLSQTVGINQISQISKEKMGFPKDKIVIAIGYCGRTDQQHIAVLDALEKLPPSILSKMYLFLHFSYSVFNEGYKKQVRTRLKRFERYGCKYQLCEEYLVGERMAYLRYGVDMFINAETNDALSGSMLEYFFGGTLVFNSASLDYDILKKRGVYYISFSGYEDLVKKVEKYSENVHMIKSNRKAIWDMCSWKKRISQWNQLYQ